MFGRKLFYTALVLILLIASCKDEQTETSVSALPGNIIQTELGVYYLPANYTSDKPYPLIVLLHGMGQHESFFVQSYGFDKIAESFEYILCAPKSKTTYWHVVDSPDRKNVISFIRYMKERFRIDEKKVALFGFSAGAGFTNTLVFDNIYCFGQKKYFTAFICGSGGSGYLMDRYMAKGRIPDKYKVAAYFFWGEREIPPPGKKLAAFLKEQGWQISTNPHQGLHFIPDGEIERSFRWLEESAWASPNRH